MSLSLELRSNIIVFRVQDVNHLFMIEMFGQQENSATSPDKKTAVTVFDTNAAAKKAFKSMQSTLDSFKTKGE